MFPSHDSALLCFDFYKLRPLVLLMTVVLDEDECSALVEWHWQGKSNYFERNLSLYKSVHKNLKRAGSVTKPISE